MSTVALMHTRRFRGLFVAALNPPLRRHVVIVITPRRCSKWDFASIVYVDAPVSRCRPNARVSLIGVVRSGSVAALGLSDREEPYGPAPVLARGWLYVDRVVHARAVAHW